MPGHLPHSSRAAVYSIDTILSRSQCGLGDVLWYTLSCVVNNIVISRNVEARPAHQIHLRYHSRVFLHSRLREPENHRIVLISLSIRTHWAHLFIKVVRTFKFLSSGSL